MYNPELTANIKRLDDLIAKLRVVSFISADTSNGLTRFDLMYRSDDHLDDHLDDSTHHHSHYHSTQPNKSKKDTVSDEVERIIREIRYTHLYLTLLLSSTKLSSYGDNKPQLISNLSDVVLAMVTKICKVAITDVTVTNFVDPEDPRQTYYLFTPVDEDGNQVFGTSSYVSNVINKMILSRYLGYKVLSSDPLASYAVDQLKDDYFGELGLADNDVVIDNGIAILRLPQKDTIDHMLRIYEFIDTVSEYISSIRSTGTISYTINSQSLEDVDHLLDLADSFGLAVLDNSDPTRMTVATDLDTYITIDDWLRSSVEDIKIGNIPYVYINVGQIYRPNEDVDGDSDSDVNTDVNTDVKTDTNITLVTYGAMLSYRDLTNIYPELVRYNNDIHVGHDYMIKVRLFARKQIKEYQDIFAKYVQQFNDWSIVSADNYRSALATRLVIADQFPDLNSYIIPSQLTDHKYNVIVNTGKDQSVTVANSDLKDKLVLIDSQYSKDVDMDMDMDNDVTDSLSGLSGLHTIRGVVGIYDTRDTGPDDNKLVTKLFIPDRPITANVVADRGEGGDQIVTFEVDISGGPDGPDSQTKHLFDLIVNSDKVERITSKVEQLWKDGHFSGPWTDSRWKYFKACRTVFITDALFLISGDSKYNSEQLMSDILYVDQL